LNSDEICFEFVRLCGMLDYENTNSKGIRRHNKAMHGLRRLSERIVEENADVKEIFLRLLEHSDPQVRLSAATNALRFNLCSKRAEEVLKQLTTTESFFAFEAEMALRVWRGEFSENQL